MSTQNKRLNDFRTKGFSMFRGLLPQDLINKAHDELDQLFDLDLKDREKNKVTTHVYYGAAGKTHLDDYQHILIDVFSRSPAFDRLFELVLTNPDSAGALEGLAGKNVKLRGYNVRRMTTKPDIEGKEWHRDSRGEVGWSLLLTDAENEEDGATSLIEGSHLFPICPRKDALFPMPYQGIKFFLRNNIFSKMLGKSVFKGATGARGKAGDFAIFINDVWHGREPNLTGKRTMVVLVGAFPTELPFPDTVEIPTQEVLNKLPPTLRKITNYTNLPDNKEKTAYLYEMFETREKLKPLTLFWLSKAERRMVDKLTPVRGRAKEMVLQMRYRAKKVKMILGSVVGHSK